MSESTVDSRERERVLTGSGLPARVAELEAALEDAEQWLANAAVWITETDRHIKVKLARERARAALNAKGADE